MPIRDIDWIDGEITCAFMETGPIMRITTRKSLESRLDASVFQRVHRRRLSILSWVESILSHNGEYYSPHWRLDAQDEPFLQKQGQTFLSGIIRAGIQLLRFNVVEG